MNGQGGWLRRLGYKLKMGLVRFLSGRYGTDKLNSLLLWTGVLFCLASMFVPRSLPWLGLALTGVSYVLMGIAVFRCLSRNTYKRYQENRRYLAFMSRLKDREHKFFSCPKCHQKVRVPKGKGKIAITCPQCREKFTKKT